MANLAILELCKKTVWKFNYKVITNNNLAVYAQDCSFAGNLFNPKNIYFLGCTDIFLKYNIAKLSAPNMYFKNKICDEDVYHEFHRLLNFNMTISIHINKIHYDEFIYNMNRLFGKEKDKIYIGDLILPFDPNKPLNYTAYENIKFLIK